MPKLSRPWFRLQRRVSYVTLDGKRINLGSDRKVAFEEYGRLIVVPIEQGQVRTHTLTAFIDAYLTWLKTRRAPDTFESYR